MIKKFIELKNIGKFQSYRATGDVEFRKLNLLYAENGRGKTTLCDVMRSLKLDVGDYIVGRTALGSSAKPELHIKLESSTVQFKNGAWSSGYSDIEIFDSSFVHENVYAGDYVDHDHKKNLYQIIVGEQGVSLAKQIDALDVDIRRKNDELSLLKTAVAGHIPQATWTTEQFLALVPDPDIDSKIGAQTKTVSALERSSEIKIRAPFVSLPLPDVPEGLATTLGKTLDSVQTEAESRVNEHIEKHTNGASAEWLSRGVQLAKDSTCPFCAQSLTTSDIVATYRVVFGQEYQALKSEIKNAEQSFQKVFGNASELQLQQAIIQAKATADFWKEFVSTDAIEIPDEKVLGSVLAEFRRIVLDHLSRKAQSPLDPLSPGIDWADALNALEQEKGKIRAFNSTAVIINAEIANQKKSTEGGNLAQSKADLSKLTAIKKRFEPGPLAACEAYKNAVKAKNALDKEKADAKTSLDDYAEVTFAKYQGRINRLLVLFNAGFRLTNVKRSYTGGKVSSTYQISINSIPVDLGDASTPLNVPCFRNTLSSGDRTTLGLAFFLAQLEDNADLSKKVIVFDDPFTSQDRFRRTTTQQLINKYAGLSKQTIVLSHDPDFLKLIWDASSGDLKTLQLARVGTETVINEWDIEAETRPGYIQDFAALLTYSREGQGERRDVARKIRPVLEGFLRNKFPGKFQSNEWLGDFIVKIRESEVSDPLHSAQGIVEEVGQINDYSKHYHHQQNPDADSHPLDDGELQGYVQRTLSLVGGY